MAPLGGASLVAVARDVGWCRGGDDETTGVVGAVADIRPAIEAVEAELGGGQEYFEVTATAQLTNLFVAVDDATSAGAVRLRRRRAAAAGACADRASGFTFGADAIDFDEDAVLDCGRRRAAGCRRSTGSRSRAATGTALRRIRCASEVGVARVTVAPDGTVLAVDPDCLNRAHSPDGPRAALADADERAHDLALERELERRVDVDASKPALVNASVIS